MYRLSPPAVYAHDSVTADPRYKLRLQRVVDALETRVEPVIFADEDLPRIINEERLFENCGNMGEMDEVPDPKLVLNTFRFDGKREERTQWLAEAAQVAPHHAEALLGYRPWAWANYNLEGDPARHD